MKENHDLFLPANFFAVRTPLFPKEDFFLLSQNSCDNILSQLPPEQQHILLEAIAVASSSLYKALLEGKENSQIQRSLLKYFLRITSRSTPFGLFSFVSSGTWNQSTSIHFDLAKIHKRMRPDMEWMFALINQISKNHELLPHLFLKRNPLLFESSGRVFLNYYRKKKGEDNATTISIRSSFLTQAIFKNSIYPIQFTELLENITQSYPTLDIDKVKSVIIQLIEQQYLCLNIQPSLLTDSPFDDLLNKLDSTPASTSELYDLLNQMKKYNETPLGQGRDQLATIQQTMEKIATAKNFVQVDLCHKEEGNTLSHSIAKELAEAAEVLWRISNDVISNPLSHYHDNFLEKYGTYRLLPLMDLIHEGSGLGIPEHYENPSLEQPFRKQSEWGKWLRNQWSCCIHTGKDEIELTEELLDKILEKADKTKAIPSFDLFCEVIANSSQDIDAGNYLLSISNNSLQGGATIGRFLDLMGEQTKETLRAFLKEEEAHEKDSLFAQSSYLSYIPRNANVAIHPNLRRYAIDLGGNGNISLSDIYVGSTGERFYLTLKNSQQELIITTGNMLINEVAPYPLRLIRDISHGRYLPISSFFWVSLKDYPFLPRIRFKKTILSPARWNVDLFQLGLSKKDSHQKIETAFLEWAHKWKLPRYFFLGEGDQRILMDLEHPTHLKEISAQIKNDYPLLLTEKLGQVKGEWVQSTRGTHFSEFIVPFIKNPKYAYVPHRIKLLPQESSGSLLNRWKLPGSEWLFAKCYLNTEQENRFLVDEFFPFVNQLVEKRVITDWFYIRYGDSRPHLRLRFKGDDKNFIHQFMPLLHDWMYSLLQRQSIRDITFSPYEREIERYGGEELIELAESLFCADSKTTIEILGAVLSNKINLKEEVIAALSLIDLLNGLGLKIDEQLALYSAHNLSKKELKGFREYKHLLTSFGAAILQDDLIKQPVIGPILNKTFQARRMALKNFSEKMREQQLLTPQEWIQNSLIHMHSNRLLGRDPKKEAQARLYAFHTLSIINRHNIALS